MSQDEDSHPPTASELQADFNPSISTTTTTTTLNSPVTSRVFRDRPRGRCGSLKHSHHEKTPATQLVPDGYSAGHNVSPQQQSPVDSMDGPRANRRRVDHGQRPTGFGAKETNASMFQLLYGHSPTDSAPSHSVHTYARTHVSAHIPTQSSTYAGPIHTAPSQWTSGGNMQVPEYYYHGSRPTTCVQPVQIPAYHQSLHNSNTHVTRTHQAHTPTGPTASPYIGPGLGLQSTLPIPPGHAPAGHIPPSANAPLFTSPVSSPAGPIIIAGGSASLPAVSPRFLAETANPLSGDAPIGWPSGPSPTDDELNLSPLNALFSWDGFFRAAQSQPEDSQTSGEGAPFNSRHFEEPISTPQYNQSLSSTVIPGGSLSPSAPLWPTPAGFSFVEGLPSHLPRPLVQDNLAASGQAPNSGGEPNGSDIHNNVIIPDKNGKLVSPNQNIGPDRSGRTRTRREAKPYQRPGPCDIQKTRPVKHEYDLERLEQRCRKQGADEVALGLLRKVFANEVSQEALTRSLTDAEVETNELGIVKGKVYTAFLDLTDEGEGAAPRHICRLCRTGQTWKHAKDVVRHLKRDHLGLADTCKIWYVLCHCER
jgi:hypothetical protein